MSMADRMEARDESDGCNHNPFEKVATRVLKRSLETLDYGLCNPIKAKFASERKQEMELELHNRRRE